MASFEQLVIRAARGACLASGRGPGYSWILQERLRDLREALNDLDGANGRPALIDVGAGAEGGPLARCRSRLERFRHQQTNR